MRFLLRPNLALYGARRVPLIEAAAVEVIERLRITPNNDGHFGHAVFDGSARGTTIERELLASVSPTTVGVPPGATRHDAMSRQSASPVW
ncbi:hypothetical protein [Allorhizocola rhizosphaerae]|uniref:hypothetical protein n=1 Tax=Allorhizocola rhizosphaerae TaxID=1872709 RepID=UPI0013C37433|nr:hypothetical protein [Allorhizocola rhizosphaerae]